MDDVAEWASSIKLGAEDVAMLRAKQVDGELLLQLKSTELEEDLNMTSSLDRKRFLIEVDRLRGKSTA